MKIRSLGKGVDPGLLWLWDERTPGQKLRQQRGSDNGVQDGGGPQQNATMSGSEGRPCEQYSHSDVEGTEAYH